MVDLWPISFTSVLFRAPIAIWMCDPRLKSLLGQNTKGAYLLTRHQCGLTAKTSKDQSTSSSQAGHNSQEQSESWQNHFTSRFHFHFSCIWHKISLCVSVCLCISVWVWVCVCVCEHELGHIQLQSYPTLCNPMDSSPPGSSVHGILQARILEWVAMPCSRGSSGPRDLNLCFHQLLHYRQILCCRATRKESPLCACTPAFILCMHVSCRFDPCHVCFHLSDYSVVIPAVFSTDSNAWWSDFLLFNAGMTRHLLAHGRAP